ncbi:hypothetical protein HDU83_002991 [Entophlyctis luteolus]|nr:hypothetical protein HDU83_002991 [Entophlyctis luteolus]
MSIATCSALSYIAAWLPSPAPAPLCDAHVRAVDDEVAGLGSADAAFEALAFTPTDTLSQAYAAILPPSDSPERYTATLDAYVRAKVLLSRLYESLFSSPSILPAPIVQKSVVLALNADIAASRISLPRTTVEHDMFFVRNVAHHANVLKNAIVADHCIAAFNMKDAAVALQAARSRLKLWMDDLASVRAHFDIPAASPTSATARTPPSTSPVSSQAAQSPVSPASQSVLVTSTTPISIQVFEFLKSLPHRLSLPRTALNFRLHHRGRRRAILHPSAWLQALLNAVAEKFDVVFQRVVWRVEDAAGVMSLKRFNSIRVEHNRILHSMLYDFGKNNASFHNFSILYETPDAPHQFFFADGFKCHAGNISRPTGIASYPAIFSYPEELQIVQHLPGIISIIQNSSLRRSISAHNAHQRRNQKLGTIIIEHGATEDIHHETETLLWDVSSDFLDGDDGGSASGEGEDWTLRKVLFCQDEKLNVAYATMRMSDVFVAVLAVSNSTATDPAMIQDGRTRSRTVSLSASDEATAAARELEDAIRRKRNAAVVLMAEVAKWFCHNRLLVERFRCVDGGP